MRLSVPSSSLAERPSGLASCLRKSHRTRAQHASTDSLDLHEQERVTIERALHHFRGNQARGGRRTENRHRDALAKNEAVRSRQRERWASLSRPVTRDTRIMRMVGRIPPIDLPCTGELLHALNRR